MAKALKKPKANASVGQMKTYLERVERRANKEREKATLKAKVEKAINGKK
jgi:uncharacterized protein (UPF0335 family)